MVKLPKQHFGEFYSDGGKQMHVTAIEPHVEVMCKICFEYGTLKKNIGDYCYMCLRNYKIKYPEYINV